jgi:glyoxylase-like metal-dependent hydrolase (beta-lactamase superfamily II)
MVSGRSGTSFDSMLDTPLPRLHATAPEPLPFAPSLQVRAFVLEREHGNLLVYAAPATRTAAPAIEALGGVTRHYLNHWHEAGFGNAGINAPISIHADDRVAAEGSLAVDDAFSERTLVDPDFELIPTPGHTPGATAFLWDNGEQRLLFTGDSVYLRDGEWVAAVLDGTSDRTAYIESLELLREVEFDVLVPWAARGESYYTLTDPADARRRFDAILERLRRGEDH